MAFPDTGAVGGPGLGDRARHAPFVKHTKEPSRPLLGSRSAAGTAHGTVERVKILVAIDDSPEAERAVDFVTRVRWPAGSRVLVVTVTEPIMALAANGTARPGVAARNGATLRALLVRAEHALRAAGFPTEARIERGDPADAVLRVAREERVDLLVMGAHGGAATVPAGNVATHGLTHAPCSVLLVRPPVAR